MTVAFDSNVLIYAHLEAESEKGRRSIDLLRAAGVNGAVVPAQVLGEFLWIVRRRRPDMMEVAITAVKTMPPTLVVPPSTRDDVHLAAQLSARHRLQFWDALIRVVSSRAGADHLLSEDMQDGAVLEGVRVINPFEPGNNVDVDRLLPSFIRSRRP